jgi:hypothetical protein
MDDLIERLRREVPDLASTAAPFDDLQTRVARRARHRRIASGVVGLLVAATVIGGAWAALGREADDATVAVNLVRRDDALVAWAYRTLVLRPSADGFSSEVLVADSLLFIPSSFPDRVWVGIVDEGQEDGRLTAVREVSVDGQVTVPDTRPPDGSWPVAAVSGDLVFQREGELLVWDPATGREVDRLPGQLPVAWQGSHLAWCDAACRSLHMADLASGARRTIELPAGATGVEALRGAFSPDENTLAVAVRLGDGEDAGRQLALIDVETGQLTLVPQAVVPTPYVFIDWAPSGATVFITGGQHGGHRQVVEYRVGDAAARAIDVEVGDFYGMAVFPATP